VAPAIETIGDSSNDLEVGPHAVGDLGGAAAQDDAPLEVRHRALLLGPLRARQHDVRE
jgi:hypothetical protein